MISRRSLATILFVDIVGSTQRAADQGDAAWRELLDSFFRLLRRELRRLGGREINTTGDGMVATFDRPGPGIHCAWAIRDVVHGLGIEVRSGLHMGEVEKRGPDIGGIAVHIARRVAEEAQAGEILVSRTIRDAEQGSGFQFEERGAHELKGVTGEWHVFTVEGVPESVSTPPFKVWLNSPSRRGFLVGASAFVLLLLLAGLYARSRDPAAVRNDESSQEPLDVTHRQVTFLGNVFKAAVSPDGKTIAYITRHATEDDRLFVRDLAGGEPLEIVRYEDVFSVRWSPTGENLLVGVGKDEGGFSGAVLLIPRLGGQPREFESARFFDWSPDARRFAFAGYGSKQLILQDIATGDRDSILLPDSFDTLGGLDWSPRGHRIAYLTHEQPFRSSIWTIGVSGEGAHRVVDDTLPTVTPRWTWNGDAIYYRRGGDQFWQTNELVVIEISPATGEPISSPRVSASGSVIGYFDLFKDGNRILYVRSQGHSNLWLFRPRGSGHPEIAQLTQGTAVKISPSISPDGRHIAFSMLKGESANIHLVPMEGGATTQLTHLRGRACCLTWSPDGTEIAFLSTHGGKRRIWKVRANGGTPRPYPAKEARTEPSTQMDFSVQWAPGSKILYTGGATQNLYLLDPASGKVQPLISPSGSDSIVRLMDFPHYSPDGSKIAGYWGQKGGIWTISLLDGQQTFISRLENQWQAVLGWSLDEKWIYAYRWDSSKVVRYSTEDFSIEVVATVDCGSWVGSVVMAPDAKRFVCVGVESQSDLWVMEASGKP